VGEMKEIKILLESDAPENFSTKNFD